MKNIDDMTDDEIIATYNSKSVPVATAPKSVDDMTDDEVIAASHAGKMKSLPDPFSNRTKPEMGTVESNIRGAIDTVLKPVGDVAKGYVSGVAKTTKGLSLIADKLIGTGQNLLKTEKQGGTDVLKGFAKQQGDIAESIDKSSDGSASSFVGRTIGAIAAAPGSMIAQGAQIGSQFVDEKDPLYIALGKTALGAAAGKSLEGLGNAFSARGSTQKGVDKLINKSIPESAAKSVDDVGTKLGQAVDTIKGKVSDEFAKSQALWDNTKVVGDVNGGWKALQSNPYVKKAATELTELQPGNKRFGDLAQKWQSKVPGEAPTVGQIDALKQYMNKSLYSDAGIKIAQTKGYDEAVFNVNELAKGSSNAYKETMNVTAPLQDAKNVLRKYVSKDDIANPTNIINMTGKKVDQIAAALKTADIGGSAIVQGYIGKQINTLKSGVEGTSLPTMLNKIIPNQGTLDNLVKLADPEDAALMKALWQAKVSISASPKIEKLIGVGPMIQKAKEFIHMGYVSGDKAFLNAVEKGQNLKGKQIQDLIQSMLGAEISTATNNTSTDKKGTK